MKEELNGRVENKIFESVEPFSKSRGFVDLSCKPVECRQHDRIAADVQGIALSLFKEYVNSLKDFSSLIKVKQNVKTKESSTSPMHSPTHSCRTENWPLQLDGTDDNFQRSSLNIHCSKKQAFGHDTPMPHDTERNLIKDDCAPFRSLNINNKINSLWNSKLDSSNLSSVSGQSTSKYQSGISYSGLGDCAKRITKSKHMHEEFENKCKLKTEKQSLLNCEQTNRYGGPRVLELRDPLLMTRSDYIMNSAGRLNPVLLNSNLEKVKSEAAFHRPYTKTLWPPENPVSAACSSREVRMRSWLQLRTIPTYHTMHMDTCEKSSTSHTNGADTKYVSSYSDDVPDNLRRTEKLSSPSSSELSMQSVISIKINDEDDERKSREFDPDCADNVRCGHHGARLSNTELPPFSRSLISTPSTPVDRTLSNHGLTPAELNTLISPTSNVIKRSRPVPSRTPQRPLSMNVECATARPNILRLPRQQCRTVKTDVATQTDEIPSLNGAQNRSAEPEVGPDADAMVTMSKVKNGTLVDSTETLSPVETWPLSIQSIVKPAEFPRIFLPTTFNNPNLSAKDDESEACLSVSSSQEVTGVAATFYTNPTEGWNVASSGFSRRSSLAGPCQTSTNALRPPVSRAPALMRQTRFPNGIHKFDSTNAESHRCRSVHFSTDVLVAHTGLGPAPLMLSSAPLKEAALPPFDCAHQSVDPERISSRKARRSSSVSMLISTNPNSNSFDSHRTYVPTTEPCLVSPLSPIRRQ